MPEKVNIKRFRETQINLLLAFKEMNKRDREDNGKEEVNDELPRGNEKKVRFEEEEPAPSFKQPKSKPKTSNKKGGSNRNILEGDELEEEIEENLDDEAIKWGDDEDDEDKVSYRERLQRTRSKKGDDDEGDKERPGNEEDRGRYGDEDEDKAIYERDKVTGHIMHVDGEEEYKERDLEEREDDMGYKLEPFNLREEMEQGEFDEEGFYMENKRGQVKDAWLDSVENEPKRRFASKKVKSQAEEDDEEESEEIDSKKIIRDIVAYLQEGENVNKALMRLSKQKRHEKKTGKVFIEREGMNNKEKGKEKGQDAQERDHQKDPLTDITQIFDFLTERADRLLSSGYYDAYTAPKAKLLQELEKGKDITDKKAGDGDDGDRWEYQDTEGKVQGPYSGDQMQSWRDQKYFPDELLVRPYGRNSRWTPISQVFVVNENNEQI